MRSNRKTAALREVPIAPGRLPLLGHLPSLARKPLAFMQSAKSHGDVVLVYLGRTPTYLVTNPDLVRRVLVADVNSFAKGIQYEKLSRLLGNSLSTTHGTEHRDRRRLMQPAFHHEYIAQQAKLMREAIESLTSDWKSGQVVAIDDAMRALSLTIVARALCSTDLGADMVTAVQRDLPLVLRGVAWRVLLSSKTIERLPLPTNRRFIAANKRLRDVVTQVIERYRSGGVDHGDLLSLLLSSRDADTGATLTDDQIRDEVVNILFAGTETTGNAMAWMWHAIGTHPEVEQLLHAEALTGDMGYARRVVRETLRLYPPPWLVSRQVRQPVRVGDYELPVGAQVLFSPYAIQRDSASYPEALRFDPDRWLPERIKESPRQAFLAFGAGPQNCIGESFAMLEMMTVATAITARYRLIQVGETKEKPPPS